MTRALNGVYHTPLELLVGWDARAGQRRAWREGHCTVATVP